METADFTAWPYVGKIGADNALLILCGILHLLAFFLKRPQEGRRIDLLEGLFFLIYGFFLDIYRLQAFRALLLYNRSYTTYRVIALIACLLPVYVCLVLDIKALILRRIKTRRLHE